MITMLTGDCRAVLPTLPAASVHCVVTSPPYWGLRDYGTATWEGGDPDCDHSGVARRCDAPGRNDKQSTQRGSSSDRVSRDCLHCGAVRIDAQLGLEPDFNAYVANMVGVFRDVRRVLRDDGTLWLNLGDSYASSGVSGKQSTTANLARHGMNGYNPKMAEQIFGRAPTPIGLKPKDLCGIPWRVAFALQADGWYLRQDIIWSKPNPMPESVTDRCTKAHEYLFLLSKRERYYYDADAIAEDVKPWNEGKVIGYDGTQKNCETIGDPRFATRITSDRVVGSKRNKRSVWEVTTQPFSEAHFATFPPALIEPCIKAGTSEKGCCGQCGKPWVRMVEKIGRNGEAVIAPAGDRHVYDSDGNPIVGDMHTWGSSNGAMVSRLDSKKYYAQDRPRIAAGWSPSCACAADTVPCTVLDPFAGAGTTGLVADRLQRNAVLIELNPAYAAMGERRIVGDAPLFVEVAP